MYAQKRKNPRANGGGGRSATGESSPRKYSTPADPSSTKRAGSILDQWVLSTYLMAASWQRLFELSGETPGPKVAAVVDYLVHRFTRDTIGQMALFLAWREHGLGDPRREPPADIPAHNFAELRQNVTAFYRVLVGMGRLEDEEAADE